MVKGFSVGSLRLPYTLALWDMWRSHEGIEIISTSEKLGVLKPVVDCVRPSLVETVWEWESHESMCMTPH